MTGSRRSSRLLAMSPKGDEPAYNEEQSALNGNHEEGGTHNGEQSNIEKTNREVISGVRRNANDDGLEFYHTQADKWIPGDEVPPELLRAWAKSQIPPPRPSPELELDSEVTDVKTDPDVGLMVHYRKEGRNEAGKPWPFEWVPTDAASLQAISAWAETEKKRVEGSMRYLNSKNVSLAKKRLLMLEDLLDGVIIEPDWMSESPSPNPNIEIPLHAPHYPLPTLRKGYCHNTTHPSSSLTHTALVAACQASNHLSPHHVCTACYECPPTQRLTQQERDHIIRGKGIFPLCPACKGIRCEYHDIDPGVIIDNCTCKIQLPQWLCDDCWVENARARTRRADACVGCNNVRAEKEEKGQDVVGEGVHMCSGCMALVVKGRDEQGKVEVQVRVLKGRKKAKLEGKRDTTV